MIDALEHAELADGALLACLENLRDLAPWDFHMAFPGLKGLRDIERVGEPEKMY